MDPMLSFRSIVHKWRNPLNRMPWTTAGLRSLPVEIWQLIFYIAGDLIQYPDETEEVLGTFFHGGEGVLIRDPIDTRNTFVFRT